MKVSCIANSGKSLPGAYLSHGYFAESVFRIAIGKEYLVFGMALWDSRLMVLLSDEDDLPNWYPVELFSLVDPRLPTDWMCNVNMKNEGGLKAVWGYESLVLDDEHHDALQERESGALEIFQNERNRRLAESPHS